MKFGKSLLIAGYLLTLSGCGPGVSDHASSTDTSSSAVMANQSVSNSDSPTDAEIETIGNVVRPLLKAFNWSLHSLHQASRDGLDLSSCISKTVPNSADATATGSPSYALHCSDLNGSIVIQSDTLGNLKIDGSIDMASFGSVTITSDGLHAAASGFDAGTIDYQSMSQGVISVSF